MVKKLEVQITGNTKGLDKAFGSAESRAGRFQSKMGTVARGIGGAFSATFKTIAIGAAGATIAIGGMLATTIPAASDQAEALSKVNAVFGQSSIEIQRWADTSAEAFGQSKTQALEAIGTYGNLFQAFGIGQEQAKGMSQRLVELAADLASFNNTSIDEALQALQSGISGETEPLKRYGIAVNDLRLREQALAMGLKVGTGPLDARTKALASYELILKDTKLAQGDFARTSDGLANKQRILQARFENLKARIGGGILPIVLNLATVFEDRVMPVLEEVGGGVRSMFAAFQSPSDGITSGGFAGKMEEFGIKARRAFDMVSSWWESEGPGIRQRAVEIFGRIRTVIGEVVAFIQANWPKIRQTIASVMASVQQVIASVVGIVQTLWRNFGDNILGVIRKVFPILLERFRAGWAIVAGIFETVSALLQGKWGDVWEGIKKILANAMIFLKTSLDLGMEALKGIAGIAWEVLRSLAAKAWDGIKTLTGIALAWLVGEIEKMPGRIKTAATGMWDGLKDAFRDAVNWIIRKWNDLELKMPEVDTHIPGVGKVGGFALSTPNLPEFHTGGVIPGPRGVEIPIMGLAGERVLSPHETRAYEAGGGGTTVILQLDGKTIAEHVINTDNSRTRMNGRSAGIVTLSSVRR